MFNPFFHFLMPLRHFIFPSLVRAFILHILIVICIHVRVHTKFEFFKLGRKEADEAVKKYLYKSLNKIAKLGMGNLGEAEFFKYK
jgi:hypothetical protein